MKHLQMPDEPDALLLRHQIAPAIRDWLLLPGDRFSWSQEFQPEDVLDGAALGGVHVLADGPCQGIVVRRMPSLAAGQWVVNLHHLGTAQPGIGRVTRMDGWPWVGVMLHDLRGQPYDTIGRSRPRAEPLDARWLLRIARPAFPLDRLVVNRAGVIRQVGALALSAWSPQAEQDARAVGPLGPGADDLGDDNLLCQVSRDPLLCRAFGWTAEELGALAGQVVRQGGASEHVGIDHEV